MSVVDASVWVSRLAPGDVHHEASRAWLEGELARGALLVSPSLLLAEVAGALSRRTGDPALAASAVRGLLRLSGLRLVSVGPRPGRLAAQLSGGLGLRGSDALYVAVSYHLGLPLVTLDREQQARAGPVVRTQAP